LVYTCFHVPPLSYTVIDLLFKFDARQAKDVLSLQKAPINLSLVRFPIDPPEDRGGILGMMDQEVRTVRRSELKRSRAGAELLNTALGYRAHV
jgi:hypothetical protein